MEQIKKRLINTPLQVKIFSLLSAFIITLGFYKFEILEYTHLQKAIILLVLFVSAVVVNWSAYTFVPLSTHTYVCCTIFSFTYSTIYICFQPVYIANGDESLRTCARFFIDNLLYILGLTIFLSALFLIIIHLVTLFEKHLPNSTWSLFKHPVCITLIIFISWLPCYLSYYPGIMSYDMFAQTPQALGVEPLSKYHPPLHTLFWKFFLELESHIGINALVGYSITQMLILASCLAYLICFFARKRIHTMFLVLTLLFFCLNPVVAIFSFIPAKDVLFAASIILFSVEMLSTIGTTQLNITSSIRFVITGVLCCLLRNNMIYAFIAAAILTIIILKRHRKRIALWSLATITCFSLINGPIYSKMGILEGNVREMLSVPIQQISYVVVTKGNELSDADIQSINQYLPCSELWYLYKTRNVDLIKVRFNTSNFTNDPNAFIRVWANIFSRYTDESLVTFFNLNIPYWYPSASTIDPNTIAEYIETCIYTFEQTGYEVSRASILPNLNTFYENFVSTASLDTPFVSSNLFSITAPIWVILFTLLILLCRKKTELMTTILPTLFLWCTYLLGPVSNCRYVFPIMMCYPLFLILIFEPSKFNETDS